MPSPTRRGLLRRGAAALLALHPPFAFWPSTRGARQSMITTSPSSPTTLTVRDLWPDRATYMPGQPAVLHVALVNTTGAPQQVALDLRLRWLDTLVATRRREVRVAPGEMTVSLPLDLPRQAFRGYGADLTVSDRAGHTLAHAGTALDVLADWTQAPRYGFLCDFGAGEPHPGAAVDTLARYHVNVVQFYDWMWRHYTLMPPTDEFTDALGRALSLHVVRAKVAACHAHGMAALGYAAVYGAEPEYALAHPAEMLYDGAGVPYSLEKLFYVMNIHAGNPWRTRMLREMARAVRETPFDGLHLDQYGFPKDQAFGPAPQAVPYDLAADFPAFIDAARRAVRRARPGSRVIFNAVGNWPIETVGPTTQDATYIEVWPPYESYADLRTLILQARRLAPAKQVILAAYLSPLLGALDDALPPAQAATLLTSAAIWANGGFHLLLGERNGALCDPYYPKYATLLPDFARLMRSYYDFVVRYENALADRRLITITDREAPHTVRVTGAPTSPRGDAGHVWTIVRRMPGLTTLSLINLTGAADARWNTPKPTPPAVHDLRIDLRHDGPVRSVFAATPDGATTAARPLDHDLIQHEGQAWVRLRLPHLAYWSLIVVQSGTAESRAR